RRHTRFSRDWSSDVCSSDLLIAVGDGSGEAGTVIGLLGVADTVRSSAAPALAALRDGGVQRVVMMTGDNAAAAMSVAAEVGIREIGRASGREEVTSRWAGRP